VERDYDTSLPDLTGDREQLIQAILNIARNAAQAMQGRARSSCAPARTARSRWPSALPLALELQVIDNGPGIPETDPRQIFYPLVSGREGGSGLGLTLAQSFIQQHHGTIESTAGPAGPASHNIAALQTGRGRQPTEKP
jgi:two-component system nitrogen regulation sensor histidine kinase GlnL